MNYYDLQNNFQFKGFIPNKTTRKQGQFVYSLIESRSPSDSKKTALLIKKGRLYEARLKISSAGTCSFEIFSIKHTISDSIKSLQKQFLSKIITWNKVRRKHISF